MENKDKLTYRDMMWLLLGILVGFTIGLMWGYNFMRI